MAGKHKWAHRGPKRKTKKSKEAKFSAKQRERREAVNEALARRRAEIHQFAQS